MENNTVVKENNYSAEIEELKKKVHKETEKLLSQHIENNKEKLIQYLSWKELAEKDDDAKLAIYMLVGKYRYSGADYIDEDDLIQKHIDTITNSIINWIEMFGYVYSPKTENKHLPFFLFDFQKTTIREIVSAIEYGYDVLIEKSREMGVSWLMMYIFVWYWLFAPTASFLIGSYREKEVIESGMSSLFGKIKYILEGIPKWMMPKGFNPKKHIKQQVLENPQNGSTIVGATMSPTFGRGGRYTAIFFDELAFWGYAKSAWEASAESTNCRIGNSTPRGYNYFKQLIDSGLKTIRLHWKMNPLKTDLWYKYKQMTMDRRALAQEVDISYDASIVGVIYDEWTHKRQWGQFEYDPSLPLFVAWDFGNADGTALIWAQVKNEQLVIIDSYYKQGEPLIEFFIPFVTGHIVDEIDYIRNYTQEEIDMIREHATWKKAVHFGDPAGRQHHQGMVRSVIEALQAHGIWVNTYPDENTHRQRQAHARRWIHRGVMLNKIPRNEWLDVSMSNYRYKSTKKDGTEKIMADAKPVHDEYSHMATAFEYLTVGLDRNEFWKGTKDKPISLGKVRNPFAF